MKIKNIAVPIDDAPGAAFRLADRLAEGSDAIVHLFSVRQLPTWATAWEMPGAFPAIADGELAARDLDARTERAETIARGLEADTEVVVGFGDREASLLEFLESESIDLAIMSHERVGFFSRFFHGNLTGQIARSSVVPVFAVGDADTAEKVAREGIKRILVATLDSDDACGAASFARAAALANAELIFNHVIEEGSEDKIGRARQQLAANVSAASVLASQTSRQIVTVGSVADSILEQARADEVDLIIVGSHPHESVGERLVGTTCDRLLAQAEKLPVLVLPRSVRVHAKEEAELDQALASSMPASDPMPITPR